MATALSLALSLSLSDLNMLFILIYLSLNYRAQVPAPLPRPLGSEGAALHGTQMYERRMSDASYHFRWSCNLAEVDIC